MALENIILEHEKGIATIFINRPEKLNALNKATIQELHDTLKMMDENPDVRVIIITGSGEKAFVAGADIAEFAHFSAEEGALLSAKGQQLLFDFIENMNTPVIAAINGIGNGLSF
jgi:enoyl-CoA hydratase